MFLNYKCGSLSNCGTINKTVVSIIFGCWGGVYIFVHGGCMHGVPGRVLCTGGGWGRDYLCFIENY